MLAHAKEHFERHNERQRLGYDLNTVAEKVALIYGIDSAELFRKGRQKPRVDAKALFCYWAARELKMPLTDLARKLEMTITGVGYVVQRGEAIALAIIFICLNELFSYLRMSRSPHYLFKSFAHSDFEDVSDFQTWLGIINNRRFFLPFYLDCYRQSLCHIY